MVGRFGAPPLSHSLLRWWWQSWLWQNNCDRITRFARSTTSERRYFVDSWLIEPGLIGSRASALLSVVNWSRRIGLVSPGGIPARPHDCTRTALPQRARRQDRWRAM